MKPIPIHFSEKIDKNILRMRKDFVSVKKYQTINSKVSSFYKPISKIPIKLDK